MRLLVDGIVYGRQTYGGINTYFNQVLPRIAGRPNTTVDLLLPSEVRGRTPGPPVRPRPRNVVPHRTGVSWRLDDRLEPLIDRLNLGLNGLWAMSKRDVVFHSTYFTSLPVPVPHVAIAHDLNHELFPHLYREPFGQWLRRRYPVYLRRGRRIIAVSNATKRNIVEFYGIEPDLIDVVHLATDPTTFYVDRDEGRFEDLARQCGVSRPFVLYVGVHSSAFKNFSTLLAAMRRFDDRSLSLVVAGPPWNHKEEALVAGLPEHLVRLVPNPDDATLRVLYSFATAFVYPSMAEGFGIPLLEAMACGTPIVGSDIDVFHEVAGDAAIYFKAEDADGLQRALERCLDARVADEYRSRGFRRVAEFSWDRTAAETYRVYEKALV